MIQVHTESSRVTPWIRAATGQCPLFVCVLGFTETGLIPGISAAGATPANRQYTAIADAEFLHTGPATHPKHPLPPLHAGASPVFISRAVTAGQTIPVKLFNAGLPHPPTVPYIDLNGQPARCLSTGNAMDSDGVHQLFHTALDWGDRLGTDCQQSYLMLGECVVGGTTTALAILKALGWSVDGMVNSSHPTCNHAQKQQVVAQGLHHLNRRLNHFHKTPLPPVSYRELTSQIISNRSSNRASQKATSNGDRPGSAMSSTLVPRTSPHPAPSCSSTLLSIHDPLSIVAGVGDPVQVAIAGMMLAASRSCNVMLAGGTQMLAIYALATALAETYAIPWNSDHVIVGTTRWVADDPTGNTIGLAQLLQCPLISTRLSFASSRYPSLRAYEQGFVKEGVGAGGCAIAAELYQQWEQADLLNAVEAIATAHSQT